MRRKADLNAGALGEVGVWSVPRKVDEGEFVYEPSNNRYYLLDPRKRYSGELPSMVHAWERMQVENPGKWLRFTVEVIDPPVQDEDAK